MHGAAAERIPPEVHEHAFKPSSGWNCFQSSARRASNLLRSSSATRNLLSGEPMLPGVETRAGLARTRAWSVLLSALARLAAICFSVAMTSLHNWTPDNPSGRRPPPISAPSFLRLLLMKLGPFSNSGAGCRSWTAAALSMPLASFAASPSTNGHAIVGVSLPRDGSFIGLALDQEQARDAEP